MNRIRRNRGKVLECPLEECLGFLAGAWTPKILWHLRDEPLRFCDLKREIEGISAKVLTTRLRELEARNLIRHTQPPHSPSMALYSLTPLGVKFQPILDAIVEVGASLAKSQVSKRPRSPRPKSV